MFRKNITLFNLLSVRHKWIFCSNARNFSILERYIRARPHDNELKINDINIDENKKDEDTKNKSKYYSPNITRGVIPKSAYMNTWKIPEQPENPKFLKVAIIGAPNSGKSSLLNAILDKTISSVSPKINTTKQDIKGIYTKDNVQLIFIDSPGIIPSHKKKKFCKELVNYAWKGYEEADLVVFVVDTVKRPTHDIISIIRMLAPKQIEAYNSDSEDDNEKDNNIYNVTGHKNEDTNNDYEHDAKMGGQILEDDKNEHNMNQEIATATNNEKVSDTKYNDKLDSEQIIDYFSYAMDKNPLYNDKSVKENLFENRKKIIESYNQSHNNKPKIIPPVILVLNKVDLCTESKWSNARAKEFMNNGKFDNIFFISAKYNKGVEELIDYISKFKAKEQLWAYPKEESTTLTKVQIVEQLINTYLYCWFNKDVPYKIKHHMISWHVNINNSIIIEYQIVVKSDKVAKMICGVHNKLILNMRKNVSYKLTKLWGQDVYVHIHVKSINS
ncbi:hypothetical protein YYE_03251 [Plasmodium vinckei vinckei]|nr:hypothetical protein YYE_03251 [Plasmodium vinckei vinckei]